MSSSGTDKSVPSLSDQDDVGVKSDTTDELFFEYNSDQYLSPEDYYRSFEQYYEGGLVDAKDRSEAYEEYWEEGEYYPFYSGQNEEGEEVEEKEEHFLRPVPSFERHYRKGYASSKRNASVQEPRRRSLFAHSSPTHFPDVNKARKSVFGSIFLRTTAHVAEEAALLRTVADSSYTMLQSLLNSFDKIIASNTTDGENKLMTRSMKESIQRDLEAHGISKSYLDGNIVWNIYPITQNYLFTVQIGDNIHQTRHLSRIEERILMAISKKLKVSYMWPTDSIWSGYWDTLSMNGSGTYTMPHGVSYFGKMKNGMFHDTNATLTYPNNFKAVQCVYEHGKLISCQFQFPDSLMHEKENWGYCKFPDRRFWSEVQTQLKPSKLAQKTQIDPPRRIPPGCYDTSDGFYNPKTLMLTGPYGELLRVPVCEEDFWIKKYCRKGFLESADFRPDLFENWFDYDQEKIQSILNEQAKFRSGKITFEELQQFYADQNLLPTCSKYKKRKSPSEIAIEEFEKSIPEPKPLKKHKHKNWRHRLLNSASPLTNQDKVEFSNPPSRSFHKSSKSWTKVSESKANVAGKASKISFKVSKTFSDKTPEEIVRREIPEKFLKHQPILRPPFQTLEDYAPRTPYRRKCSSHKFTSTASSFEILKPESSVIDKRNLQKFMKSIIMSAVTDIIIKERERQRKRLMWAQKIPRKEPIKKKNSANQCLEVLEQLFLSIPDKEEYCDSDPKKTCDLRKLAEDKYCELKYWGNRIFSLSFNEG